ncbi:hypothetical protein LTR17_007283 [Elasticomyces elasticus]|nr:hypothetical protein LTR17_007283 [Elasticomyces elasticus]
MLTVPPITNDLIEGRTSDRATCVADLLARNHDEYAILIHGAMHSHVHHIVGNAYSLGGSEEHLRAVFDGQASKLDHWTSSTVLVSNDDDLHRRLGDKTYEHAFLVYFDQRLQDFSGDWKALMQEYLLGERALLSGVVGGFAHPLILFADAIDLASPKVAVEALAMLAVDYNPLHRILDASAKTPVKQTSALATLERIGTDDRFDGLFSTSGVGNTMAILGSEDARNAVLEHFNSYIVPSEPDETNTALLELAEAAILLLAAVDAPKSKHEFDIYLTHQLTFVWSIRVLIAALPSTATRTLFRAAWLMMVLTYITQLRPKIVKDRITRPLIAPPQTGAEWERLKSAALENTEDPHYTKVIRTLWEFATLWPHNEALFLNACVVFERDFAGWKGFDIRPEH